MHMNRSATAYYFYQSTILWLRNCGVKRVEMKRNYVEAKVNPSKSNMNKSFMIHGLTIPTFKQWLKTISNDTGKFHLWCQVGKMKICCSKTALAINQDSAYKEAMAMSATLGTTNKKIDSMGRLSTQINSNHFWSIAS